MDHHNFDVMPAPIITPLPCFADNRGWFMPVREGKKTHDGRPWVQDNVSMSYRGVLRGLHFQHPGGQAKLLTVLQGEIFDVVVDIRRDSPEFSKAQCLTLRATEAQQLLFPGAMPTDFLCFQWKRLFITRLMLGTQLIMSKSYVGTIRSWISVGRSRPIRFFRRKTPQAAPSKASRKTNYQP